MSNIIPIANRFHLNRYQREVMATIVHSNGLLDAGEVLEHINHDEVQMRQALVYLVDLGKIQVTIDWKLRIEGSLK